MFIFSSSLQQWRKLVRDDINKCAHSILILRMNFDLRALERTFLKKKQGALDSYTLCV